MDAGSSRSYCTEKLWHAPVKRTTLIASLGPKSPGHVKKHGNEDC
jgi:hypothetical protein